MQTFRAFLECEEFYFLWAILANKIMGIQEYAATLDLKTKTQTLIFPVRFALLREVGNGILERMPWNWKEILKQNIELHCVLKHVCGGFGRGPWEKLQNYIGF